MKQVAIALGLVLVAVLISWRARLKMEGQIAIASIRALVQLSVLALVIDAVFDEVGWAALALVVMVVAASWTSATRLGGIRQRFPIALNSIVISSGIATVVMFGSQAFPFEPRYLIPLVGITVGNCMTATSLAGSRLRDELIDKAQEVEARLSLGVPASFALRTYVRRAATTGLIPIIDSTKNVGLIVLPGAFVGMILGGASPSEAAEVQLVVLFMLLGAVSVAGMLTTYLVARTFITDGERLEIPRAPEAH